MSLCERAKTRVRVDCELSEEFEVKVGMHQDLCYLFFLQLWLMLSLNWQYKVC